MTAGPWWLIDGTSGTPPQYVVTQYPSKPQPANPKFTVTGPYASQAAARAAAPAGAKVSEQAWNTIGGTIAAAGAGLGQELPGLGIPTGNPLAGADAIGAFFGKLGDPALWYRALEIAGGVLLLYLGLNRMTGGKIGQAVTGTRKAAGVVRDRIGGNNG